MKKIVVGIAVLGTLVLYSLGIRHEQPRVGTTSSIYKGNKSANSSDSQITNSDTGGGPTNAPTGSDSPYTDGTYTGSTEDAFYGDVRVRAVIRGGKLTAVDFLQYPDTHSTSVFINRQAMPMLQQEAIQAQNAQVDIVSGATYTSQAFIQSLSKALSQAH